MNPRGTHRRIGRRLAAAAVLLVISGCSAPPPSASLAASGASSEPPASALLNAPVAEDPLLQVSVDGLRMRSAGSTGADVVRTLDRGEVVRMVSGPVEADGYPWYEVLDLGSQTGWVAAGDGAAVWIESVSAEPATSELLLRFQRDADVSPRTMSDETLFPADLTVTADGRVVLGWNGVVRQLSPSGLARIQHDVLELPALQESADYLLERLPGSPEPPGHGLGFSTFWVGDGTEQMVVHAVAWLGDEEGVYWVPSPERQALDELASHLLDIEAWLGTDGWAEPNGRRFVSDSYLFWLWPPNDKPPSGVDVPAVDGVVWPFAGPIEQYGELMGDRRCGYLNVGQAFETLRLMHDLGVPTYPFGDGPPQLSLDRFGSGNFATDAGWFDFFLTPRGPDGYPGCPD